MGLFWDLVQQGQLASAADRTASVEQRLERAEAEVERLSALVRELILRLEARLGDDLNQDGRVG